MTSIPKSIVLVEDDPEDVELFQSALEDTDPYCQLITAKDGNGLMNLLEEIPTPDLIVMDVNLPRKSGKECLEEIRSKKQFDQVPVIILTSYQNPRYIDSCLRNGATRYYIKPATFNDIKKVVQEICSLYA